MLNCDLLLLACFDDLFQRASNCTTAAFLVQLVFLPDGSLNTKRERYMYKKILHYTRNANTICLFHCIVSVTHAFERDHAY